MSNINAELSFAYAEGTLSAEAGGAARDADDDRVIQARRVQTAVVRNLEALAPRLTHDAEERRGRGETRELKRDTIWRQLWTVTLNIEYNERVST